MSHVLCTSCTSVSYVNGVILRLQNVEIKIKILATPSLGEHRVSASNWSAKKSSSWSFTAAYWYPHFIYCYNGFYHSTTKSQTPFNLQNSCGLFTSAILPNAMDLKYRLKKVKDLGHSPLVRQPFKFFFSVSTSDGQPSFFPKRTRFNPIWQSWLPRSSLAKRQKRFIGFELKRGVVAQISMGPIHRRPEDSSRGFRSVCKVFKMKGWHSPHFPSTRV